LAYETFYDVTVRPHARGTQSPAISGPEQETFGDGKFSSADCNRQG